MTKDQVQVIVIDDDKNFRKLVNIRLKAIVPGCNVTDCDSLGEAKKILTPEFTSKIDLAILDQHLLDGLGSDLLKQGYLAGVSVLSMSSDQNPSTPGTAVSVGAGFFLAKSCITEPLFEPLINGLIEKTTLQRRLASSQKDQTVLSTVRTLVSTLRHEINNPLGAVLGAAYLLQNNTSSNPDLIRAAEVVESSGNRIKHVLDELCAAIELEAVSKADQLVFQIPGDKKWES